MYIHIGSGKVIRKKNIVGIFDLDTASHEKDTREFLKKAEKDGILEVCGDGLPKAFILTSEKKIYLTTLSAKSLFGRTYGGCCRAYGGCCREI